MYKGEKCKNTKRMGKNRIKKLKKDIKGITLIAFAISRKCVRY